MAADPSRSSSEEEQCKGGELLFCGGTAWSAISRKVSDFNGEMLLSPTRLAPLINFSITYVASGSASCHCVAVDVDGRCFTWGRNEKGQLGHGDFRTYNNPTVVSALTKYKLVKAGAGRHHTVVLTDQGDSFAFGCNKHGQLGSGSAKNEVESLPVRSLVAQATHTVCGADFTVWLSSLPGSSILTAGLPQYGQLGHGTDNEYNAKESSVKIVYEPQPRPRTISIFAEKRITKVACGNNHTVAVDSDGFVYTWGFGGHGRLGHKEQKDEWIPRMVEQFQRNNILPKSAVVAAGSAYSACTAGGGQLYMWGRVKPTGDNWMYPKPVFDLSGWSIRCMDSGDRTSFVGAEESCISWGQASYGELGYGPVGPKSSASAKKVDLLEGMHVLCVACGVGHSLIVVDRNNASDRLEKFDVYEGNDTVQASIEDAKSLKSDKKRKVSDEGVDESEAPSSAQNGNKKSTKKPKRNADSVEDKKPEKQQGRFSKKQSLEVESCASDLENDSEELTVEGRSRSQGKGRGRGRGQGQGGIGSSKQGKVEHVATTTRGRGRGRSRGRGRGQ